MRLTAERTGVRISAVGASLFFTVVEQNELAISFECTHRRKAGAKNPAPPITPYRPFARRTRHSNRPERFRLNRGSAASKQKLFETKLRGH